MSAHNPQAESLLTAALVRAAEVAAQRTGRSVSLVDAHMPSSTALLRFDLTFDGGAKLTWLVTNEDATGVSDLLIGGAGDRGAVLTEMHLDALSGTFSEMLEQAVEAINERLSLPLTGGNVDMGMEGAVPELVFGGSEHVSGLEIEGFGLLTVVQQANVEMTAAFTQRYQVPPEAEATHAPAFDAQPNATPASAPVSHASELTSPAADSAAHQGEAPAGEPMQPAAAAFPAADASSAAPAPAPAGGAARARDNVVQLPQMGERDLQKSKGDIRMLLNVPLQLTVELGRAEQTIRDLLELNIGSIVELAKLAGDPLDIMVNGHVLARGEVVVIDEEFGIRVTEILTPEERLRRLG